MDASRIICPQEEYTDLSEEGQAPFISLCSSASEFLTCTEMRQSVYATYLFDNTVRSCSCPPTEVM